MKTPSPQEAAKMVNRQIAEQIRDEMKLWIAIAITLVISGKENEVTEAYLADKIERALNAKDLEADKNGYERGRKDLIEDISDVIADDRHADNLAILRAVVQYLDKARLDLRKANGK